MNIYQQTALQRKVAELEAENERMRELLKYSEKYRSPTISTLSEEAIARKEFLDNVKPLGYHSAREYIEAMATKYSVDLEEARQAFLACGYDEWNTGFIDALMEMSKGE